MPLFGRYSHSPVRESLQALAHWHDDLKGNSRRGAAWVVGLRKWLEALTAEVPRGGKYDLHQNDPNWWLRRAFTNLGRALESYDSERMKFADFALANGHTALDKIAKVHGVELDFKE